MSSRSTLEDSYLGEPGPRHPSHAFLLSLLCPGLGFAYLGRFGSAVTFALASVGLWAGFVLAWSLLGFHPRTPLLGFCGGWVLWVLMGAFDAAKDARRVGGDYVLQDGNHPLVYVSIAVFAFALPLAGVHHWATTQVWTRGVVDDDAMYPTLIAGESVWIDRRAYVSSLPNRGEVVAYRVMPESSVQFGRVVGIPGDTVSVAGASAYVNDTPLPQRYVDAATRAAVQSLRGAREATSILVEEHAGRHYLISTSSQSPEGEPREWTVGDELFVMHDRRAPDAIDRVAPSMLVGRPMYFDAQGGEDASRLGAYRVQAAFTR